MKAISLFSSGGIADLALEKLNIDVLVANELLEERAILYQANFPKSAMLPGDIRELKEDIIKLTKEKLGGSALDFLMATPPCQGMSKNGQGKLLKGIRDGSKPKIDFRNRLIIPTIEIVLALQPRTVIFENVPEMMNTIIDDESGKYVNIIEYIHEKLADYVGKAEVVNFADYGVPQRRQRLITIFTRDADLKDYFEKHGTFLPARTHSKNGVSGLERWVSLKEVIGNLPKLDAKEKKTATSKIPFHRVPVLDPKKYIWISHTPPEKGAFDNQCINQECLYQGNLTHGATRDSNGINSANKTTPLYCIKCGQLLPRPYTKTKDGNIQLMSGYTSAYKRMSWSLPASTLTTNLSYPSSDHKIHPDQNRVLSLYEAFKLHTVDSFQYKWEFENGEIAKDTLITEIIGESVPPMGVHTILKNLLELPERPLEKILTRNEKRLNLTY